MGPTSQINHGPEVVVIGAGVVGCAVASKLARSGTTCWVLERAAREGTGITSRNSGVIHSGLYYPPTSRKARTCIRGQELLFRWCAAHRVDHARIGKLVIARNQTEAQPLADLLANARQSGARGLEWLQADQVRHRVPDLHHVYAAIWSPNTGIVDTHGLTRSLRVDAERHGAEFLCHTDVTEMEPRQRDIVIHTSRGSIATHTVINAAGLDADRIARMVGLHAYTIYPCRGDYYWLLGPQYNHLIYPVRDPHDPGLGVHLTPDLGGQLRVGPDARYVPRRDDFHPDISQRVEFLAATRRLLGEHIAFRLRYEGCGIRPKLRGPDDPGFADFVVEAYPSRVLHLLGIESPGLTAALALAEDVEGWYQHSLSPATNDRNA